MLCQKHTDLAWYTERLYIPRLNLLTMIIFTHVQQIMVLDHHAPRRFGNAQYSVGKEPINNNATILKSGMQMGGSACIGI